MLKRGAMEDVYMKTVACRIDLGYTRIAGYTLFDLETLEFQETTPKDVMDLMKSGKVNGLTFDDKGEIVPDLERWNLSDIMIKSGVGNYRHLHPKDTKGSTIYSVVRAIDIDGVGRFYEVINNRCSRIIFKEEQLIFLSQLALVGGIKVNQDTEDVELCEGVKVENQSKNSLIEVAKKLYVVQENNDRCAETLEYLFMNSSDKAETEAMSNCEMSKQEDNNSMTKVKSAVSTKSTEKKNISDKNIKKKK